MTTVTIRELPGGADGVLRVRVDFGDGTGIEVDVRDPASAEQERLLTWYFEEHLRYPFLDGVRAGEAAGLVSAYGRDLFGQVFAGEAGYAFRQLRQRGFDGCRLVVEGSPAVHRLHWETLEDPDPASGRVALRMPVTRRVGSRPAPFDLPTGRSVLRILVVTARPNGSRDVGYRTISRPLSDAVARAGIPVAVDIVRPGTWQALLDQLRATSTKHGTGWYQVIHFDVHGGFGRAADFSAGAGGTRYLFDPAHAATARDKGRSQGFLFFETATTGRPQPVPAAQVAKLLAEHRVGVAVLNACQSAMADAAGEASLALELASAGTAVAVGMAYSVTVSAAARAMPVFYEQLAAGADPVVAGLVMRRHLHDDKTRRGYFDMDLELEDWVLPVVFGQRDLAYQLAAMSAAEQEAFYERQADASTEPHVEYGFVGRDLDIHELERRLLLNADSNLALVQGLAGSGKSTLLRHVAWWWQHTGLIEQTFFFSYEQRAWTAEQITRHIATQLLHGEEFARWEAQSPSARTGQLTGLLRARRCLLVLDNAESITASPAAIPHSLPDNERKALAKLLAGLRRGRTLVLIGSRQREDDWLAPAGLSDNVYPLPGLDPQAASDLLHRIVTRHGGVQYLTSDADPDQRAALTALIAVLDGSPLLMTVVLPQLGQTSPVQVLADLAVGRDTADPMQVLRRAIEYSHGRLDPAVQQAMLLLAPFTTTIPTVLLDEYRQHLASSVPDVAEGADLPGAVTELIRVGLAAPHPHLSDWVQIVPSLPFFLRNRLHDQPDLAATITQAHYQLYSELAGAVQNLLTDREPGRRALGGALGSAEYANLTTALGHAQNTGQPVIGIIGALEEFLDQAQQHEGRRRLLDHAIAVHPDPQTPDQQRELLTLHNLAGATALEQRRWDDAHAHYQTELAMKQALDLRDRLGITYHQLGRVAQEQRQWVQAEQYYHQALDILLEFDNRLSAASTYHQLGVVTQKQRQWVQAEQYYRQALGIKLEFGDRYNAASTYHQLGVVAQEQRQWVQAEQYYHQALDTFLEFGDRYSAARIYHNLGVVAQEQRQWVQAEQYYRQALDTYLEFGDRYGAAGTYHQLGRVAQEQRQWVQAEQYYRQALDIKLEFGDRLSAASTYHQLGVVAQEQRQWVQAEQYYRQALDIKLEFGDRINAANTYHNLGVVAQEQRQWAQAEQYYRQALDIKLDFGNRYNAASTWHQLGILLAELDRRDESTAAFMHAASIWRSETDGWPDETIEQLRRQRARLSPGVFERLVADAVPPELRAELLAELG